MNSSEVRGVVFDLHRTRSVRSERCRAPNTWDWRNYIHHWGPLGVMFMGSAMGVVLG